VHAEKVEYGEVRGGDGEGEGTLGCQRERTAKAPPSSKTTTGFIATGIRVQQTCCCMAWTAAGSWAAGQNTGTCHPRQPAVGGCQETVHLCRAQGERAPPKMRSVTSHQRPATYVPGWRPRTRSKIGGKRTGLFVVGIVKPGSREQRRPLGSCSPVGVGPADAWQRLR
jgi:hypothetical protein